MCCFRPDRGKPQEYANLAPHDHAGSGRRAGPFNLPAALAAGFSARKKGTAAPIALGFAMLVFFFHWIFLAPMIPFMPDFGKFPLRWIGWSLTADFTVVAMMAVAGASIDRWTGWVKAVFLKAIRGRSG